MKIALIGYERELGRQILDSEIEVAGWTNREDQHSQMQRDSISLVDDPREFWDLMDPPRLYVLDLLLGTQFDETLDEVSQYMEPGDIAIDPSGAYWCDTLRRYRRMRHRSLYYLDIATLERGASQLTVVGGDKNGVDAALPFLSKWSEPGDALHIGGVGMAHYAQMVEETTANIVAQAQSEAAQMIEAWPSNSDAKAIRALWPIPSPRSPGRSAWLMNDAMHLEASVPLMAHAAMQVLGERLDDEQSEAPPVRVGPFQTLEEIL